MCSAYIVGIYGIVLAGWASNNKYSLMGGLRSTAQLITYELALGLSIVSVVLWVGSLDLVDAVNSQRGWGGFKWNILRAPLGILIFFIAALAETTGYLSIFLKPKPSWSRATHRILFDEVRDGFRWEISQPDHVDFDSDYALLWGLVGARSRPLPFLSLVILH